MSFKRPGLKRLAASLGPVVDEHDAVARRQRAALHARIPLTPR